MADIVSQVADEVVTAVNAGTFSKAFTAVMSYAPEYELRDMDVLHVTVVPTVHGIAPLDRERNTDTVTVEIGVQQKLKPVSDANVKVLLGLVGELKEYLTRRDMPSARWRKTEHKPVVLMEHLRQLHQFTSALVLTYEATA